jgi:biofilm protein TabA
MDMILDEFKHADFYLGVHPLMKPAFDYLRKTDLSNIESGKYEIDGEKMLLLAQQYITKPREQGQWEAHRRYIDIQYVYRGIEWFGWANLGRLHGGAYDAKRDFWALEGKGGDFFMFGEGSFTVLGPQDAHMPGISISGPQPVKKFVVKIVIDA